MDFLPILTELPTLSQQAFPAVLHLEIDEQFWIDPKHVIASLFSYHESWHAAIGAWVTVCCRRNHWGPVFWEDIQALCIEKHDTYGRWSGLIQEAYIAMASQSAPSLGIYALYRGKETVVLFPLLVKQYFRTRFYLVDRFEKKYLISPKKDIS